MSKVFPRAGNPWWPLPQDYPTLSPAMQRLARVNACRMSDTPGLQVHAWRFFTQHYLMPALLEDGTEWDPHFFKKPVLRLSPWHAKLIYIWCRYPYSAVAFPRGFGKTTIKRAFALWQGVANAPKMINLFAAKDDMVVEEFDHLKRQLEYNERLLADFGEQRGLRGSGLWSNHMLRTTGLSLFRGYSIEGRKRGIRGDFTLPDDIDADRKKGTDTAQVREATRETILKILVPMMEPGARFGIIGTLIGRDSFLYHAVDPEGTDPSFKRFFRLVVPWKLETGENVFPDKFTEEFIAEKRAILGDSYFRSEYCNDPGSSGALVFAVDPARHEYRVEDGDTPEHPFQDERTVQWNACRGPVDALVLTPQSARFCDLIADMKRILVADTAHSATATSDYAVAHVVGVSPATQDAWLLETYHPGYTPGTTKCKTSTFLLACWRLAFKWRCSHIAIEDTGAQEAMRRILELDGDRMREQYGWLPTLQFITPPRSMDKGVRIQTALEWRFNRGKIKLPGHLALQQPYAELYRQIRLFTPDLNNLKYDDSIDALAYLDFAHRSARSLAVEREDNSLMARFLRGETYLPGTKLPIAALIWRDLTPEQLNDMLVAAAETPTRGVEVPDLTRPAEEYG